MNAEPLRRYLILVVLAVTVTAGVVYDTTIVQASAPVQMLLAALMAASFAAVFLLQPYPLQYIQSAILAAWPLHLFTALFFWSCYAVHGGRQLTQFAAYTLFAYATYLLVPLILLLEQQVFTTFAKFVAVISALLAIPSFAGAAGIENVLGIPLRVKFSYAQFSGIAASAGVFEHAEGHAYQMAIGLFCSWYAWRRSGSWWFMVTLGLALAGLVVSQGRAAIYGTGIAILFASLPELFRRSRPLFAITLFIALTGPYLALSQLSAIPGLSGYLRVERGLSGRGEAWRYAIALIEEKPWKGHGFLASPELTEERKALLRKSGFSGIGTTFHNTFLTKAVELGLIAAGAYMLLYLVPLLFIGRSTPFRLEQDLVTNMVLLAITVSIYRDYNVGGIRSTAMIGAVFLGVANLWLWMNAWPARSTEPSGAFEQPESASLASWRAESAT